ncbi:MAG TPA: glycosyltransferase [Verrucomicrobiae bacterium]|nr:glycosyltransferase [Verrucomicrobiae bacterium]
MKLTVGLPVYNAMPFLPQSLDSLLLQTHEDFELLVIDDGSTDGSLDYLKSIKDRRLRLLSQENQGLAATLNRMLAEASTPWLVRHDADDLAFPERLARTVDVISQHPDAGMFYSYARYYQDGRVFGTFRTTSAEPEKLRELTRSGYLLAICHPAVTLNVRKTQNLGGYRFNLHVEDVDLWWRMALQHDIRLIPAATVAVRHNAGSISARNFERQCINTLYVQYLLLSHLWNLAPLPYEEASQKLGELVNRRQVRFRENTRLTNISLSGKQYASAAKHAFRALLASPSHLFERVLYEFRPQSAVVNGDDPKRFRAHKSLLWPTPQQVSGVASHAVACAD